MIYFSPSSTLSVAVSWIHSNPSDCCTLKISNSPCVSPPGGCKCIAQEACQEKGEGSEGQVQENQKEQVGFQRFLKMDDVWNDITTYHFKCWVCATSGEHLFGIWSTKVGFARGFSFNTSVNSFELANKIMTCNVHVFLMGASDDLRLQTPFRGSKQLCDWARQKKVLNLFASNSFSMVCHWWIARPCLFHPSKQVASGHQWFMTSSFGIAMSQTKWATRKV